MYIGKIMIIELNSKNKNSGYTLLELIIILVVASIVAAMAAWPITGALRSAVIFQEEADVREEAYYILTRMGQEIRNYEVEECNETQLRLSGGSRFVVNGNALEINGITIVTDLDSSQDLCDNSQYGDINVYLLSLRLDNGGGRELDLAAYKRN